MTRTADGSAGDVDYGEIGATYARYRQPEPAIAAQILAALGDARTVLNVGAGAGSYEPVDRIVTAIEPSASMRAQRPGQLTAAIDGVAEALPFPNASFDAAMASVTVHQWSDLERGLVEMRRVTRGPVVILTGDPDCFADYWLARSRLKFTWRHYAWLWPLHWLIAWGQVLRRLTRRQGGNARAIVRAALGLPS